MTDVKTINFKGKPYVMVAERLRQLYDQKHDLEVLDSSFMEIAGRVVCKVTILVDGKRYTGNAEAKIANAAPKSADETNPLECAETSALGRALAFANFGTVDGIASLDELARGLTPEQINAGMSQNVAPRQPSARPEPPVSRPTVESMNIANDPINSGQLRGIEDLLTNKLNRPFARQEYQGLTSMQAAGLIQQLTAEYNVARQKREASRERVGAK